MDRRRFVALVILDGWGHREEKEYNAVAMANTPFFDHIASRYPGTIIYASQERVGLPNGQMGNSEVGHLNIGAGRVVYQDFVRINKAVEGGEFFENQVLLDAMRKTREWGRPLHLIGLVSDGGVHSMDTHLLALIAMAKKNGIARVYVHALLDGRDTPPKSGAGYLSELRDEMERIGVGKIATVGGRYYGMDRDNRWERTERAYRALVFGEGIAQEDPVEAVKRSYEKGVTDEFVEPVVIVKDGVPVGPIEHGDGIVFFNFRADRARQLTRALALPAFEKFDRGGFLEPTYVCMTLYDETFRLPVAFSPKTMKNSLGEVFTREGIRNLRIAETEKYAHVTYFFNGGEEEVFDGETRILIPSPSVPTYDLKPEMSAYEVADRAVSEIRKGAFDVMVLNFANPDMVGHTGIIEAAVAAVEAVDANLGKVVKLVLDAGGVALVTSDHGNVEIMVDPETGQPHTAHTINPVPFIVVDPHFRGRLKENRALEDIAPTILKLLGLPVPGEMTGQDIRVDG
ncbi:MAG: 2,3-bisphosphoglycerate-independent phosphoglycerate mutase [Deltaproteobacteria bacterium]|nr:2,3-bisphosphoglycerate-independent phosphoglycerate mutase [Deltaproteobacteria bacterium]NIS76192.1 2,3-bisphosphoglycerate-independent phosphoglycerate mutase [Deltaproteobacteria bacterium]